MSTDTTPTTAKWKTTRRAARLRFENLNAFGHRGMAELAARLTL